MISANDLQLLTLAAKAYGLDVWFSGGQLRNGKYRCCMDVDGGWQSEWNPLTDDGDALRLAVRLGMQLSTNLHHRFVMVNDEQEFYDESKFGGACDPDGVMRRSIVRAAAEIGNLMKGHQNDN